MELGMQEDAQDMVLEALVERFGPVSKDIPAQINLITDRARLKELLIEPMQL